jgi:DNA replication protein DnaC
MFQDLHIAKGNGRYTKLFTSYAKTELLVFNDYGMAKLNREQSHDLLEVI